MRTDSITLWNRRCSIELIPMGITGGDFFGEVNLEVPHALAEHLKEDREGQISLRLVMQGQPASFLVRDEVSEQGMVVYTTCFIFPVGHTCSLLTAGGNAVATWKLREDGEAELLYIQH